MAKAPFLGKTGGVELDKDAFEAPFNEALVRPGLSLIAEFKRRSPSGGDIAGDADVSDVVTA